MLWFLSAFCVVQYFLRLIGLVSLHTTFVSIYTLRCTEFPLSQFSETEVEMVHGLSERFI